MNEFSPLLIASPWRVYIIFIIIWEWKSPERTGYISSTCAWFFFNKPNSEIWFLRPDWWSLVTERFCLLSRRQCGGCDMPTLEIGAHAWSLDLMWPQSYPSCSLQETFSHWLASFRMAGGRMSLKTMVTSAVSYNTHFGYHSFIFLTLDRD